MSLISLVVNGLARYRYDSLQIVSSYDIHRYGKDAVSWTLLFGGPQKKAR